MSTNLPRPSLQTKRERRTAAKPGVRRVLGKIPAVRIRRLSEAQVKERGRLRSHFLMDAGDLGSRNLTVTWLHIPAGAEQRSHVHVDAEQVYVIVRGRGHMTVAGDVEQVAESDLVFIPPATDHSIVNEGDEDLILVTAASPPVSMVELYQEELAPEVAGFDED